MYADVDQCTSTGAPLFGKPIPHTDGYASRPNECRFRMVNRSETAVLDRLFRNSHCWRKPKLSAEVVDQFSSVRFLPEHFHLSCIQRRRFFAQHVLAGFECGK